MKKNVKTIAIHHRKDSFSDKWIEYCKKNNINYKLVNCYDNNIIEQLVDCNGLMWHWSHSVEYADYLFARQLTYSLEIKGLKVFPNSKTVWHFDDKVGQKYMLEALGLPLVPTFVFYEKSKALDWIQKTNFPKVFKTRNGAGALNVSLIRTKKHAKKIIKKCFNKGIPSYNKGLAFKESLWKFKRDKTVKSVGRVFKYLLKFTLPSKLLPRSVNEKDYVYFQDFIPNLENDYRLKVVGDRCWGKKRYVRENDFRASGSRISDYDHNIIPKDLVVKSFQISKLLGLQSVAFDFVIYNKIIYLLELSYGFGYDEEELFGFWDTDLIWHNETFVPEQFMIEDFLKEFQK